MNYNKTRISLLVGSIFLLSSAPGIAADKNWTGLKLGIGAGSSTNKATQTSSGAAVTDYSGFDEDQSGFKTVTSSANGTANLNSTKTIGILDATYDYQINDKFVLGLTGNFDFGKNKKTGSIPGVTQVDQSGDLSGFSGTPVSDSGTSSTQITSSFQTKNAFGLGLRAGFLANQNTLLYLTGGYAGTKAKSSYLYSTTESGVRTDAFDVEGTLTTSTLTSSSTFTNEVASQNKWMNGYFIGAGLESKLSERVSLKLEYRFTDYGKMKTNASDDTGTYDATMGVVSNNSSIYSSSFQNEIELKQQAIRAVLNYNF